MPEELSSSCPICGKDKGTRPKFCSNACSRKSYQRSRPASDIHRYYSKSPDKFFQSLLQKKKHSRQGLSIPFLVQLWESQNGLCALTGLPMTHIRGEGRIQTNVSLDRISSTRGYEEDNIQLVCAAANRMKTDFEMDQFVEWCRLVVETSNQRNNSGSNLVLQSKSKNRSYARTKTARRAK